MFHSVIVAFGAILAGAYPAAATPSEPPSAEDFAAIGEQLRSETTVDRLAGTVFPHSPEVAPEVAKRNARVDAGTLIPVYVPTADFVAGRSGAPTRLAYVAAPATTGNGSIATVWLHRDGGSWSVYNVASGDLESRYAAEAGGGQLLHEPQVGAWYSVNGDRVTVLDGASIGVAEGTAMTVAEYRAALHDRYGDKLPGSDYARSGAAGGYGGHSWSLPPVLPAAAVVLALGGAIALPLIRRSTRR
ncbi:hypothetical protein GCM10010470_08870 [Saccharopolyspora taberi]|uniref:Secreted protein n=1 Tax=Saccharopolyspora taberi TaxID=60895 RepID=A0ABN3V593_9PSEU